MFAPQAPFAGGGSPFAWELNKLSPQILVLIGCHVASFSSKLVAPLGTSFMMSRDKWSLDVLMLLVL